MQRTAYRNGIIYTADSKCPVAEAFAVEDGHFVYVGDNEGLPDCTEQIDLGGACVIPGLVDTHCHMLAGVVQASTHMIFVDPETTPEELGDSIISKLETEYIPEDTTVICMGIDLTVGEFFAKNIDSSIADIPVMVFSNDGHALLLNTMAMNKLCINKETEDPDSSSYYVRDDEGNPTGLVIEIPAMTPCKALMKAPDSKESEVILQMLAEKYAKLGYTSIFEAMSVDDEDAEILKILQELDMAGKLPLHVSTSFGYHGEEACTAEDTIKLMKRNRDMYSSMNVRHETLKMIPDGTVEEHTAHLYESYADAPNNCGSEILKVEDMKKAAKLALKEGFSVHIHAIGDRAVTHALDALYGLSYSGGTRTIAHNQLYRSEDIERMIDDKNIFFQTTPHWMKNDNYTMKYLGKNRFEKQFPVGTMQRGGVTVTFGSDSCLEPETANAFAGMFYACARGDENACGKECLTPQTESISRMDCLMAYTINGARQLGLDHETGSITVGKLADFITLDRDLINCPIHELKEIQVTQTWFRGNSFCW